MERFPGGIAQMCSLKIHTIIALVFFWCLPTHAADINAASCSSTDVQNAINSASAGDRVIVPTGTCAWSTAVTIPNTKGITVSGGVATIISGQLILNPNSSNGSRITGFTFTSNDAVGTHGSKTTAAFRVDHNIFTGGGTMISTDGNAPGLIDHNTFTGNAAAEMIHNLGTGAGDTSGWTDDVTPGGANALYIEDNTFTYNASGNPAYFWGTSAVQAYYGARTVFRHNTLNMAQVDQHGTCGNVGARWWEIYENTFYVVLNGNQSNYMAIRDGSGVIFNNHKTGLPNGGAGSIELTDDCTGTYPDLYQIGRGINQMYSPAYVWGNDSSMSVVSGNPSNVQQGRDYFLSATQPAGLLRQELASDTSSTTYVYTPYIYPHPLQGASSAPTPPTGLAIVIH